LREHVQIKAGNSITFTFKENAPGRMVSGIVLIFLLAAVAQAQGATRVQGAIIKGTVILNGEGGQGVASVLITDSAHTGGPWATDSDGSFTLDYPNRAPGEKVRLGVIKEGYVVVNWVQLDLALPKDPDALEVYTREQLPQDWAQTQNNLGNALRDQAARTKGTRGAELLAEAVAAHRSALEVYSAEDFPLYHEQTEKQLKECKILRMQPKLQAQ
jgi:hypothetical protein